MASIWALLPADEAQAVYTALSALAERDADVPGPDGEQRTRDQCRADALGRLGWQVLADPDLPRRHAARPTVTVAVALSTLLGCDQQPGQLTGYGPIPASMARRIAAEPGSTWRRLLVDPAGRPLDYGRTTYRPPADLRDFVIARDRQCVFPGCTRHARDTDLDHHRDWAAGGHTNADNLGPLCPLHHHLKHEAGWTVERLADGSVLWRSPTGRRYVNDPDPYPVDNWVEWQPADAEPDRGAGPGRGAEPDRSAKEKCPPAEKIDDDPPF